MVVGKQTTQTVVYKKLEYIYMYKKKKKKKNGGVVGGRKSQKRKWASTKKWPKRISGSVGWKPRVRHGVMKTPTEWPGEWRRMVGLEALSPS